MYFNEKEDTNIDSELKKTRKKGIKSSGKKVFTIIGILVALIIIALIIILIVKNMARTRLILNGELNMTIYKDTTYNEPGYNAYDNKKNDLNSQVIVKSDLDTSTVGTYTITYSLDNIVRKRTIKVVERPDIITIIHLDGKSNIYLSVGEEYEEPGYSAIDAIDGDLTSKVTINSNVNTSKQGTYRIIYSVTNSEGVTTSETRTIIVQ